MTCWTPCPAAGPTGFDLDTAVLLSPDVLQGDRGCATSRATGTPWRESLWRTGSGEHVVGLDSGGAGSSGLDVDRWRWVSAVLAEDWLRRQGLDETADVLFAPLPGRAPTRVVVHLDHAQRVCLEQMCADEDLSPAQVLRQAVDLYLDVRGDHNGSAPPWWPPGVAHTAVVSPAAGLVPTQTLTATLKRLTGPTTTVRLLGAEFPRFEQLIPAASATALTITITIDRLGLRRAVLKAIGAAKTQATGADRNSDRRVHLTIDEHGVTVAPPAAGSHGPLVAAVVAGEGVECCYDPTTYLVDALDTSDAGYVTLHLTRPTRPVVLTTEPGRARGPGRVQAPAGGGPLELNRVEAFGPRDGGGQLLTTVPGAPHAGCPGDGIGGVSSGSAGRFHLTNPGD